MCSDLCLLAPKKNINSKGYTCACPDDRQLSSEGSFCYDISVPPALIVGTSMSLLEIEQEHLGRQKIKTISLKDKISKISAIAYNSLSGMLHISISFPKFKLYILFYYKVTLSSTIQNLKNYSTTI